MQIICPACKKTSRSQVDCSGKSVKCSCGHKFIVPAAVQPAATKIAITCACGRTLQVPATAAGKAVKCPCGKTTRVPAAKAPAAEMPAAKTVVSAKAMPAASPRRAPSATVAASPAGYSAFASISDAEWNSLVAQNAPRSVEAKPKEKSPTDSILAQARVDLGMSKSVRKAGAGEHLGTSRWILIGIGALKLLVSVIQLVMLTSTLDALAATSEDLDIDTLRVVIQVICGVSIAMAASFIVMGAFVFVFPMTCTITALCLYVLIELLGLIFNPLSLLNIRAWIFRVAVGGALIQAVNNAAYYKFIKSESRESKR